MRSSVLAAVLLVSGYGFAQSNPGHASSSEDTDVVEVVVRGPSLADSRRRSARAVEVVELERTKQYSGDLANALDAETSVHVQREGALGSQGRYTLAGLSGDRVRFFLDGVPLEFAGYPFGVANVPLMSLERIEVYRGVVPVRFGADALGGAVQLVSDENASGNKLGGDYQFGSFGTHRVGLFVRRDDPKTGAFVRASGYYDHADNDYPVDVEVFDERGRLSPARLERFHDGYEGGGLSLSVGMTDRSWADRVSLTAFAAEFDRELQSNATNSIPYGEVTFGKATRGGNVRYRHQLNRVARIETVVGYARRETTYRDVSNCSYDWYGRCFIERAVQGEVSGLPVDRFVAEDAYFARVLSTLNLSDEHQLRVAAAPTFTRRRGHDNALNPGVYDALRAERSADTAVLGVEHESGFGFDRIANIVFGKVYELRARSEARIPTAELQVAAQSKVLFGAGDSLRIDVLGPLYAKASYEYAARLPTSDERFGDGGSIVENLSIEPERGHTLNAGLFVNDFSGRLGSVHGGVNLGLRRVRDYVVRINRGDFSQYANVAGVDVRALDVSLGYATPGQWIGADGRVDILDARNASTSGPYAEFHGDRLPNQPYFQASARLFARKQSVVVPSDHVEIAWNVRHVGEFERGWESAGNDDIKLVVPGQLVQSAQVGYVLTGDDSTLSHTFEVQNLTDERAFDFYGVERPGRSFAWKVTFVTQ